MPRPARLPQPADAQDPGQVIDGRPAWLRLMVSMLLATVSGVGMWSVVVVLPTVQAEFAIDRADAAIAYTATMLGFAAGNVLIGRFVDRVGVTLPLIVAGLALGAGYGLAALARDITQFTLAQGCLIGMGTAAGFGPLMADISHWFRRRRGIAVALAATGNYFAGALWPLFIGQMVPAAGWRTTYMVIGLVCTLTVVPLALLLRARPPSEPAGGLAGTGGAALRAPGALGLSPRGLTVVLSLAGIACCVAMSMPQVHIVAYCADLGYGLAAGSQMLALMIAGGIVSRVASGFVADRIGGLATLALGSVLQGSALFLFIPFDGLAPLYLVSLLFGLAQGGIVPSYALIVREYLPAAEAGQRVGIVIMATIVGMALGGWMSGWIYDLTGSYFAAFLNGIAWNLLNLTIAMTLLIRAHGGGRQALA